MVCSFERFFFPSSCLLVGLSLYGAPQFPYKEETGDRPTRCHRLVPVRCSGTTGTHGSPPSAGLHLVNNARGRGLGFGRLVVVDRADMDISVPEAN